MTRHQSRSISRSRNAVMILNPCIKYSMNSGYNPFAYLFQRLNSKQELSPEEKQVQHQLKMAADQKQAKARQNRKRNKV